MSGQPSIKSKLLTATGEQISKTIKTIDKNDIKSAFSIISTKFKNKSSKSENALDKVEEPVKGQTKKGINENVADDTFNVNEEYTALMAEETNIAANRGKSGNYENFDFIDYDKDAKVINDDVAGVPKNDSECGLI